MQAMVIQPFPITAMYMAALAGTHPRMDMAPDIIAVTGMATIIGATAIIMGVANTMVMTVAATENRSAKKSGGLEPPFFAKVMHGN